MFAGKARAMQSCVLTSADRRFFWPSQGSVSCIVTACWITSTCVGTGPVAPAGTKHRNSSAEHLWVRVHRQLCFCGRINENESDLFVLCRRMLLWKSLDTKDSGLCGAAYHQHCESRAGVGTMFLQRATLTFSHWPLLCGHSTLVTSTNCLTGFSYGM